MLVNTASSDDGDCCAATVAYLSGENEPDFGLDRLTNSVPIAAFVGRAKKHGVSRASVPLAVCGHRLRVGAE
jgi:hypothetical protein